MAEAVYTLCAVLSIGCAALLFRAHRRSRSHLLFWSGLCFACLSLNNVFLLVDMLVFPSIDLCGGFWRSLLSAIAGSLLLFGLIWELT